MTLLQTPGGLRRRRILWVAGLLGAFLVVPSSATLGPRTDLARAEASSPLAGVVQVAQHATPQGGSSGGGRQRSGDDAREGTIHLNFRNVDIVQMITLMSELTGRNFLLDSKVRGTVTLIAPQPVTRAEAYQIFLAALAMQGFTVVSQGPISTIIPLRDAKTAPLPTVTDSPHR